MQVYHFLLTIYTSGAGISAVTIFILYSSWHFKSSDLTGLASLLSSPVALLISLF